MSKQDTITLTDSLANRVRELQKGDSGLMLRVLVNGGGCQGFEYKFDFATKIDDDDVVFEKNGIKVLIDADSLPLLEGSTIDFIDDLAGSSFKIINPNAKSTCGCGTSFAI